MMKRRGLRLNVPAVFVSYSKETGISRDPTLFSGLGGQTRQPIDISLRDRIYGEHFGDGITMEFCPGMMVAWRKR